jgi:hypothetical protein
MCPYAAQEEKLKSSIYGCDQLVIELDGFKNLGNLVAFLMKHSGIDR